MPNNKILTATNTALKVTNLAAAGGTSQASGTQTMEGVPLGTLNDSATNPVAVKVLIVGQSGPVIIQSYFTSNPQLVTASGAIPAGVLGWSFTPISGTVTLNGSGTLPIGVTFSGGGYTGYIMNADVNYTITSGSAIVTYDTPL